MKKEYLPLIGLLVIAVLGYAWWLTMNPSGTVPVTNTPSETPPVAETPEQPTASSSTGGIKIVNQTMLRTFDDPKWHFVFKSPAEWEFRTIRAEDGDIEQVVFESDSGNIMVGKQESIAEPSLVSYTEETLTVAGQSVVAHRYEKPNEKYDSYLYFTLIAGNYEYYVAIRSIDATGAFEKEFLKRITAK